MANEENSENKKSVKIIRIGKKDIGKKNINIPMQKETLIIIDKVDVDISE